MTDFNQKMIEVGDSTFAVRLKMREKSAADIIIESFIDESTVYERYPSSYYTNIANLEVQRQRAIMLGKTPGFLIHHLPVNHSPYPIIPAGATLPEWITEYKMKREDGSEGSNLVGYFIALSALPISDTVVYMSVDCSGSMTRITIEDALDFYEDYLDTNSVYYVEEPIALTEKWVHSMTQQLKDYLDSL